MTTPDTQTAEWLYHHPSNIDIDDIELDDITTDNNNK